MQIQNSNVATSAGLSPTILRYTVQATRDRPQRLIGIEMRESTALGANYPDIGLIYVQPKGAQGIMLKSDWFNDGVILWNGNIPVYDDFDIILAYFSPASGNLLSYALYLADADEQVTSSSPTQNAVGVYPYGHLKVIEVNPLADALTCDLRPPLGFQWIVIEASGWNDDSTDRSCQWTIVDSLNTTSWTLAPTSIHAVANQNKLTCNQAASAGNNVTSTGIMLNYNVYATFTADALTSGKKIIVRALVMEFAGGN